MLNARWTVTAAVADRMRQAARWAAGSVSIGS
jgi:hypothetical protein